MSIVPHLVKKFLILRQFFSMIQKLLILCPNMRVLIVNFASKNHHLHSPKIEICV